LCALDQSTLFCSAYPDELIPDIFRPVHIDLNVLILI